MLEYQHSADHISDYVEENNAKTHGVYELVLVSNKVYT